MSKCVVLIKYVESAEKWKKWGLYKCPCGKQFTARATAVNEGNTTSCGCLRRSSVAHLHQNLYKRWTAMKQRCYNPKFKQFVDYGGRGIKVCTRWRESFENFFADMGDAPKGLTLDRVDVNGNYESRNCRWASRRTQQLNRRKTCPA